LVGLCSPSLKGKIGMFSSSSSVSPSASDDTMRDGVDAGRGDEGGSDDG
jgi:hypothetical protein